MNDLIALLEIRRQKAQREHARTTAALSACQSAHRALDAEQKLIQDAAFAPLGNAGGSIEDLQLALQRRRELSESARAIGKIAEAEKSQAAELADKKARCSKALTRLDIQSEYVVANAKTLAKRSARAHR